MLVFNIPLISTFGLSGLFILLPQSRAHELEGLSCRYKNTLSVVFISEFEKIADRLGLEYIARACFDPEAAVR